MSNNCSSYVYIYVLSATNACGYASIVFTFAIVEFCRLNISDFNVNVGGPNYGTVQLSFT